MVELHRDAEELRRRQLLGDRLAVGFKARYVNSDRLGSSLPTFVDRAALSETARKRRHAHHEARAVRLLLDHDGVCPHGVIVSQGCDELGHCKPPLGEDRTKKARPYGFTRMEGHSDPPPSIGMLELGVRALLDKAQCSGPCHQGQSKLGGHTSRGEVPRMLSVGTLHDC